MRYALAFLLLFFPLVIFHELGHFVVAKLFRIRVTRFAFGFGKELFRFHFKGTDYRWNLIPLGGYVDLMGELSVSGEIPDDPAHFYNRPKWVRFLVMVMGPLFNLLLAFILFWIINAQPARMLKIQENPLTVGYVDPQSTEFRAGLRPGDQILKINGVDISLYDDARQELILLPKKEAHLSVVREGQTTEVTYQVEPDEKDGTGKIDFAPAVYMKIGKIEPGSPAERAGLMVDDTILKADGQKVYYSWKNNMLSDIINKSSGNPISLLVGRAGKTFETEVVPDKHDSEKFLIGVQIQFDFSYSNPGWKEAAQSGWNQFTMSSTFIFRALKLLGKSELPIKSLSGPLELGKVAKEQLEQGWISFLALMAILSLNLGIFNLLPIPVLDGGEIFVLLIEGVTRREFSLNTKFNIKVAGFFVLVSLMGVILVSDAIKLFFN